MRKKLFCILLAVVMSVSLAVPVFAGDNAIAVPDGETYSGALSATNLSDEAEALLIDLKTRFNIGDGYDNFNFSTYGTPYAVTYYEFYWYSGETGASVNITADGSGEVINYYCYSGNGRYDNTNKKVLPKFSADEIQTIAAAFLKKAMPNMESKYKIVEDSIYNSHESFSVNLQRYENGLPVYEQQASIQVNSQTGEVMSFSVWRNYPGLEFPETKGAITGEQAAAAFKKDVTLNLYYIDGPDELESGRYAILPAYVSTLGYEEYIDAMTGELKNIPSYVADRGMGDYADGNATTAASADEQGGGKASLSPEELKLLKDIKGLITKDQAENTARALPLKGFDSSYALRDYYLNTAYTTSSSSQYRWDLYFQKRTDTGYASVYVSIDAITSEVYYFSMNTPSDKQKFDGSRDKAKTEVEAFLNSYAPDKFAQSELLPVTSNYYSYDDGRYEQFSYARVVNGVRSMSDTIGVTYDYAAGAVSGYFINNKWRDLADYPELGTLYDKGKLMDEILAAHPLTLQYITQSSESGDSQAFLVYLPDFYALTSAYDAVTGKPVYDYTGGGGELYEYSDLEGLESRDMIERLSVLGIGLTGGRLNPGDGIKQSDLMMLIYQSYSYNYLYDVSTETVDMVYNEMLRRGIILAGEVKRDAIVSREQAAVFIVRAMGHAQVAAKADIFAAPASDVAVGSANAGYIAIARAMGVLSLGADGKFSPAAQLTREAAMVMIYNFLLV